MKPGPRCADRGVEDDCERNRKPAGGADPPRCRERLLLNRRADGMLRPVRQSELLRARADRRRQLRMQVSEASAVAADAAWDELSGPLLEFISRRVRRREDAEDVLQEVMLRIHRHGSDVVSDEAVTGWIYRIARNAIIDHYRGALVMTEFEGFSQVDAAHALGLSVSGMKSRVQRGREKLKAMLLDCCEVELDRRGSITDYRSRSGD